MRAALIGVATLVAATLVASQPASAHHRKGKPPPRAATNSTAVEIRAVHDSTCPAVSEYLTCSSLTVTVAAFGLTGWTARSGPAAGTVDYNSTYTLSAASWAQTVSHEVGGHHDAWHELVAKVGAARAWTDYYDLDRYGETWAEGRFAAFDKPRDLSTFEGKEIYLDCAGPVTHGYPGNYLTNRGIPVSDQPRFCQGHESVMASAVTS